MTPASPAVKAEQRTAFRALMRNPLLSATGEAAGEYLLVRRHFEWLKQWFARFPEWSLQIDGAAARLRKTPADHIDQTRPAIDRSSRTAFTKRRYALLCLALAALEQLDRQTTLGQVAQKIIELVATDRELQAAGLFFDPGNYDHRRDLVYAFRFLLDMGVLRKLDGDEQQFQHQMESTDVLYDIHRHVLAAMLQGSHSPSAIEASAPQLRGSSLAKRAARLTDDPLPATEEERSQRIRSRLVRVLLDDPILYFHDLNDEERNFFEKHRGYLLHEICDVSGLIAEVRREGIALVDDKGDLTDIPLPDESPEEGTEGRFSLMLVQWFAECSRKTAGMAIPLSAVADRVRDAGAETQVVEIQVNDALWRLRALRLIQITADGVVPLAASGRYAAVE